MTRGFDLIQRRLHRNPSSHLTKRSNSTITHKKQKTWISLNPK